ncbi:MAG: DUF3570 domain-containing protein [Flavobacterium sp.]
MQNKFLILLIFITSLTFSQDKEVTKDTTVVFKKRVLESTEVDFMVSYYKQDGVHSSVSGGMASEKLTNLASNIIVAMPLNEDDVLTVDMGLSAYTSASSSNINPYNKSGASGGGGDDDDKLMNGGGGGTVAPTGTPWQASSGASAQDALASAIINYSHSSDSRNFIWNADVAFSNEYDYTSIGFGGGIAKLFNEKNSEISFKINAYLDQWRPIYPTELHEYGIYGAGFQTSGFFNGITVLDQAGVASTAYLPSKFSLWNSTARNSYSASVGFSQVLTKKSQISIFFDILKQEGMLSTPYHRIYFADKANYYIGNASDIPNYESPNNLGVYRLADDIERLPNSRFKFPIGMRWNYYISERLILRTYYRYYTDNWDITAHTASVELPIKITDKFTVFPMYRYYTQTQSKYFAPFEKHLSTEQYYTSDYDLSTFNANQYGLGVSYTDLFTATKIWKFGLKNIDFRFNHYDRSDGLSSNIGTIGFKFVLQ